MSYFHFQMLNNDGSVRGLPTRIETLKGMILACPLTMQQHHIAHMCDVARAAPGHPVDLIQRRDQADFAIKWSARITWIEEPENAN